MYDCCNKTSLYETLKFVKGDFLISL
uniref:Uncharacterized protein n=1 Tax=Rhizophora mucronata TaxID=61149 RepID=A0A2P2PMG0_RHIMU